MNTRSFSVINDLNQAVSVAIRTKGIQELTKSTPERQVIPAGATAGFDIVLNSTAALDFKQSVAYIINDQHRMKFTVKAKIRPIALELSSKELHFAFPLGSLDSAVSSIHACTISFMRLSVTMLRQIQRQVTITNTSNAAAEYRWNIEGSSCYSIEPRAGAIPPYETATATVMFFPTDNGAPSCSCALMVKGGDSAIPPPT